MTEIDRYKLACAILRCALFGGVDSEDAADISYTVISGKDVTWDAYSEATKESLQPMFKDTP